MAVDANETKRTRVLAAVADGATRTWTRGAFAFTVSNPQVRDLNGARVLSVDALVTRNGTPLFEDRVNMPNPATAVHGADKVPVDNPLQALRDTLLDVISAVTNGGQTLHLMRNPDGSFRGDTLAVRAGTSDGSVASSGTATYATMCTGNSLAADDTSAVHTPQWQIITGTYRGQFFFTEYDTSSLGAGATITAAVHTLYGDGTAEADTDAYNIETRYKDWGGTVTTADWFDPRTPTWNALVSGGLLDLSTWNQTNNAANNLSDSGVYSSIAKTGTTRLVTGLSGMNSASAPTGGNRFETYSADQTGTTSDPLLTITYSLGIASGQMMDVATQAQTALQGY